jgi:methionyl-tRNA formyltransferase
MRIVFFGSPEAALPSLAKLLEAGHTVALAITQPDRPFGRGKKLTPSPVKTFALDHGIPVSQPERIRKDPAALELLQSIRADIHVVVAYGQIIPAAITDLPAYRSINVHFSLLPKYRGASPVQAALLGGEKKTGVTIFRLNERMDEGDILSMVETAILPEENGGELETRLASIGADLLIDTLARIDSIVPIPQDHAAATSAPKIQKEDGKLAWASEAAVINRKVRAFTPRPSAFTFFKGQRLIILKGRALESTTAEDAPGRILAVAKDGLDVCCKDGTIYRIHFLQPESKTAMDAHAYSLNGRIKIGDLLG